MDNIKLLQNKVKMFCEEREWDEFHNPKDLAIGISTEANELLDIFRFKTEKQMDEDFEKMRPAVEEELADVLFFVLRFAQKNNIDLQEALNKKLDKNAQKYPIEKAKGNNKKYDQL
ncbi:nucleotide pyrophosphohydrolase [Clostridium gelidum]|uniref:Nucleotide pyrophosphohydrolase n=1 Tax=Clostridium gelidum TaxID=704125 RepID=A0ABM7TCZ6_9CLOT|nr:nucleotide pyrophosphohydrolase [Clostridium gelidum]BCZ46982.1 nucleotide pyrophosphohydrolase [Clostridium gelidum]